MQTHDMVENGRMQGGFEGTACFMGPCPQNTGATSLKAGEHDPQGGADG